MAYEFDPLQAPALKTKHTKHSIIREGIEFHLFIQYSHKKRIIKMPVIHHKEGEYTPSVLKDGSLIIFGAKPPKGYLEKKRRDKTKSVSKTESVSKTKIKTKTKSVSKKQSPSPAVLDETPSRPLQTELDQIASDQYRVMMLEILRGTGYREKGQSQLPPFITVMQDETPSTENTTEQPEKDQLASQGLETMTTKFDK